MNVKIVQPKGSPSGFALSNQDVIAQDKLKSNILSLNLGAPVIYTPDEQTTMLKVWAAGGNIAASKGESASVSLVKATNIFSVTSGTITTGGRSSKVFTAFDPNANAEDGGRFTIGDVTIDGVLQPGTQVQFTFRDEPSGGNDVQIGASMDESIENLGNAISAQSQYWKAEKTDTNEITIFSAESQKITSEVSAESGSNISFTGIEIDGGITGDNILIGTQNYSIVDELKSFSKTGEVVAGIDDEATVTRLVNAINEGSGKGTDYSSNTLENEFVVATKETGVSLSVEAKEAGTVGNEIPSTYTPGQNLGAPGWNNETLTGGLQPEFDNFIIEGTSQICLAPSGPVSFVAESGQNIKLIVIEY